MYSKHGLKIVYVSKSGFVTVINTSDLRDSVIKMTENIDI